ncbi:universal stress protein [Stappia indica]|uniref:universal stress protein n=1 Tax=Stappia indica TaxID=538381 RepID=UPI001CD231B0|nr:universal stress protein [Stappia indica]MCA1297842.1 universal stress protein [Stappia indica]
MQPVLVGSIIPKGGSTVFKTILIPVDLAHVDGMQRPLKVGADLARLYGASLTLVGVTAGTPSPLAHSPEEYREKLEAFSGEQSITFGLPIKAKAMLAHDPAVDLDDRIRAAAEEIGADLIVMASHVPGFAEHLFASRAGYLAAHSSLSVFVVR